MTADDPQATDSRRQVVIQSRMFLSIGFAVGVMSLIYFVLAYEEAGTVMLILAAGLSLTCGVYLWLQVRSIDAGDGPSRAEPAGGAAPMYLPHASIWPFWVGVSAFLLTNGLVLGVWFLVPGIVLLVLGVVGFVRQSRTRS